MCTLRATSGTQITDKVFLLTIISAGPADDACPENGSLNFKQR